VKRLIVNADDFGQSAGINAGVMRCHEQGVLTSASLMVRWPEANAAGAYARSTPALSVGLHIDLGEWTWADGEWRSRYEVVDLDDAEAVSGEIHRQLGLFRDLVGTDPTHLDSHQHVHAAAPALAIVKAIGTRLRIPVRDVSPVVRYVGDFYGQGSKGERLKDAVTAEHLVRIIRGLPEGVTELGCHPGIGRDAGGMYVNERESEVLALCDARVRAAIEDEQIALISFRDLQAP